MRKLRLFLLSVPLASGVFGGCGGAVEHGAEGADSGSTGGAGGSGGSAGAAQDGATEDGDGAPDAQDAPDDEDGGEADVPVQTCAACTVLDYGCTQPPLESFELLRVGVDATGCLLKDPWQFAPVNLKCDPLVLCYSSASQPPPCYPVVMNSDGTLTWTTQQKVTCYPKK